MAHGAPDYYRGVDIAYDDPTDRIRGPVTTLSFAPDVNIDNVTALQMFAESANRVDCIIAAKSTNTAKIYLGFSNAVSSTSWFAELQPGASFTTSSYCGPIWALADSAAAQKISSAAW